MGQKVLVPDYFHNFSCIAQKCEETCCAGWYIAIDEVAYKKYKKVKHPQMKKRLDKEIVTRKGATSKECVAKIKLKNNRCAFLGKDNLCDIYTNLGESYLSETCRVYPRTINEVGETLEISLALSCPEAARQILLKKEPIHFAYEEDQFRLPVVGGKIKSNPNKIKSFEDCLLLVRARCFEVLQNRTLAFKDRWLQLRKLFMEIDKFKNRQDIKGLITYLNKPCKEDIKQLQAPKDNFKLMQQYWTALIRMREEKKWASPTYEEYFKILVSTLSKQDKQGVWNDSCYQKGEELFNTWLLGEGAILFENYFVHYIYERLVPLDQGSPIESFEEMEFYFNLIKLHLMALLLRPEPLQASTAVSLVQSLTRVFDHNEQCKLQLKKLT